jgi:nucleoside-diphosphate-sugar epimerase
MATARATGRLLLTGGTGFIGSRLALEAKARGRDVVVTGQVNSEPERRRLAELEAAGIHVELGQLQQPELARRLVEGCDTVIHLAAAQHESNVPDEYFERVNVGATEVLLRASRDACVRRFVYGSTIGVYGEAVQGTLDESSQPAPDNVYGRTKLAAEKLVRQSNGAMETCVVRISETYGPGDFRLLKLFRAIDRGAFIMIGAGSNRRQLIHVNDLVRGLLLAADHPAARNETFVLAGGEVITTRDMVQCIAQALHRPPPRWHAPMWPFNAAAIVLESTLKPLGLQSPLHRRRLDFFRKSFVFSTVKAQSVLGFAPSRQFAGGASETAAWYRERGYLS